MTKAIKSKVLISALIVALVCVCLCTTIPTSAAEITPTASGSCGGTVNWEYYKSTGELKILGSGEMTNYDTYTSVPWYSYSADIKCITIADGITNLGDYAFYGCSSITGVEIPSSATRIGNYTFARCYSLKSIHIPASVNKLGAHRFYLCKSLESITVGEGSVFLSFDGSLYSNNKKVLWQYALGKADKSFIIPDGVTKIYGGAFGGAKLLEHVTVPDSVTNIGAYAFYYCPSLRSMTLLSECPAALDGGMLDKSNIQAIYVPASSVDAYKAHEVWSEYKDLLFPFELGGGIISLGEATTRAGETVSITVSVENNPGAAIASITLDYDTSVLTLKNVENGEVFPILDTGLNLLWSSEGDCVQDGFLATLTFEVKEGAPEKDYIISAVFNEAYNYDFDSVSFTISDGKITVINITYGDVNGDTKVDSSDVILLRKYMAGYNYDTGTSSVDVDFGADTNGDGEITATDVILLRKYMADYNYDTGNSSVVLGPPKAEPPVTTNPVTTEIPEKQIPYKANISIELINDGNGVYVADEIFAEANTYRFVEAGKGYAVGIAAEADKVNKIETTVSYAWDGEYIYGYVVANDPTLLAVGESIANDPYSNWSYDGFEFWYKLGGTAPVKKSDVRQFWASLNGYALNAQSSVKSNFFNEIEWDCEVNRETNTCYLTFRIPAKTESGAYLNGGDKFYTAIQMDDRRDATKEVYYCATYNAGRYALYDEYVLADVTEEQRYIPYKAEISIALKDNGNGVYVADEIFSAANTYKYIEIGTGYAGSAIGASDKKNKIETTVSYAWDGEYIYGYVVAHDPTLLAVGENVASDAYNNWKYDGFELWYNLGGKTPASASDVDQFWASLNGYALTAQSATKSVYFDDIEWNCAVNRDTKTSYITFKMPARTEGGILLQGADCVYVAIQMDDLRNASNLNAFYCSPSNQQSYTMGYSKYILEAAR